MLEICVESKKNQAQRDFTVALKYRGQCVEGPAAGAEGFDLYHMGLRAQGSNLVCVRTVCPTQPRGGKNQANDCLNQEAIKYILGTDGVSLR